MELFFPKTSFADSSDGLITIRRGQGPSQQVLSWFPISRNSLAPKPTTLQRLVSAAHSRDHFVRAYMILAWPLHHSVPFTRLGLPYSPDGYGKVSSSTC